MKRQRYENDHFSGTLTAADVSSSMISTRIAALGDYALLADLGRRAFHEAFGKFQDPADMQAYLDLAFHPDAIRTALMDPACTFLIASFDGEPVGYAKLKRSDPPEELQEKKCVQLERIYALQAFVGKKIGKTLMQQCIRIANNEHFEYLWLGVWQQNVQAISFYKKWGFEVIGTKQFIIGKEVNDDFVMALKLTESGTK